MKKFLIFLFLYKESISITFLFHHILFWSVLLIKTKILGFIKCRVPGSKTINFKRITLCGTVMLWLQLLKDFFIDTVPVIVNIIRHETVLNAKICMKTANITTNKMEDGVAQ